MDESRKKTIMVGAIVLFLALAIVITVSRKKSGSTGDIERGVQIWVKCRNPKCEAEYQVGKRDYYTFIENRMEPTLICEQCEEESVYRAIKCPKCELVFEKTPAPGDFPDRCPKCKFSLIEDITKKGKALETE